MPTTIQDLGQVVRVTSGTSLTLSVATSVAVGEHIIVAAQGNVVHASIVPTVSDSRGNSWHTDFTLISSSSAPLLASCRVTTALNAGDTITVVWPNGQSRAWLSATRAVGLLANNWWDVYNTNSGSGPLATVSVNGVAQGGELIFSFLRINLTANNNELSSYGAGYIGIGGTSNAIAGSSGIQATREYKITPVGGTVVADYNLASTVTYRAFAGAYKTLDSQFSATSAGLGGTATTSNNLSIISPITVTSLGTASSVAGQSSLSLTVPPSGATFGTSLLVGVFGNQSSQIGSVTDTRGNVYTIDNTFMSSGGTGIASCSVRRPLHGGDVITVKWVGADGVTPVSQTRSVMGVARVTGIQWSTLPRDVTTAKSSTGNIMFVNTPNTTQAQELIFVIGDISFASGDGSNQLASYGSGYTGLPGETAFSGTSGIQFLWEYKNVGLTGIYRTDFNLLSSQAYRMNVVTYRAATPLPPGRLPDVLADGRATTHASNILPGVTIYVDKTQQIGTSGLQIGVSHIQHSLEYQSNHPVGVAEGKSNIGSLAAWQNTHMTGYQRITGTGATAGLWALQDLQPTQGTFQWNTTFTGSPAVSRRGLGPGLDSLGNTTVFEMMRSISPKPRIVLTAHGAPAWMNGTSALPNHNNPPQPAFWDEWADMVVTVLDRFTDIEAVQIWNEMKGYPNRDTFSTGGVRGGAQDYTDLYNVAYTRIKNYAASVGRNILVGGPYLAIGGTQNLVNRSADPIWSYDSLLLNYWLTNKLGADFICFDYSLVDFNADTSDEGINNYNLLLDWVYRFQRIPEQIREMLTAHGEPNLPIWFSEAYFDVATARNGYYSYEQQTVLMTLITCRQMMGGANVCLWWDPEGADPPERLQNPTTGEFSPFTDMEHSWITNTARTSTPGQPYPSYHALKKWRDTFPVGSPLFRVTVSEPHIQVYATHSNALIINTGNQAENIVTVNGNPTTLLPYEVKVVNYQLGSFPNIVASGKSSGRVRFFPENGDFPGIVITGSSGATSNTTIEQFVQSGEPNHSAYTLDYRSGYDRTWKTIWWTWTAPQSGIASFNTFGSKFDTVLAVYTGNSLAALQVVGANDNAIDRPIDEDSSKVTFNSVAGTTYRIVVGGAGNTLGEYTGDEGNVSLNWSTVPVSSIPSPLAIAPQGIECTLSFNGLLLNDKAGKNEFYWIEEIDGLYDPDLSDQRAINPDRLGETAFPWSFYNGRNITLSGRIFALNLRRLREMQQTMRSALSDLEEHPLIFNFGNDSFYINCRKTTALIGAERQDGLTFSRRFQITLRASDPRFLSMNKQQLNQGNLVTANFQALKGRSYDKTYDIFYNNYINNNGDIIDISGQASIAVNSGNFEAYPEFVLWGPMSNPFIFNSTTGQIMEFSVDIEQNENIHVNVADRSIRDKYGTLNFNVLSPGSEWIVLDPGSNNLGLGVTVMETGAGVSVSWNDSWI